MGDGFSHADLERFMRAPEGKQHLEEIRESLVGRTVTGVSFSNETHLLITTLKFDDGEKFVVSQPTLEVEAIQEQFGEILEREYYVDFPERKSTEA